MRIQMLTSMPVTVDGVTTVQADKDDELRVGDAVGADLIASGYAESLEPLFDEAATPKMVVEQKDAGDADENKDAAEPDENKHAEQPPQKKRSRRRAPAK